MPRCVTLTVSTGDKILIVGPSKSGKSAIANFLTTYPDADRAASPSSVYTPTVGCRYEPLLSSLACRCRAGACVR